MKTKTKRSALTLVELLMVFAIVVVLVCFIVSSIQQTDRTPSRRNICHNNLRQISLALVNYSSRHGSLPPAYTTDADGKPLHSWRTLILPHLEELPLFDSIDFKKPWDDPVNSKAANTVLYFYTCPSLPFQDNRTTYLAIVTPTSCIRQTGSLTLASLGNAGATTLLVIEVDAAHAVPWMSPVDADEQLLLSLIGPNAKPVHGVLLAAFADGRVETIDTEITPDDLRAMISGASKVNVSAEVEE